MKGETGMGNCVGLLKVIYVGQNGIEKLLDHLL